MASDFAIRLAANHIRQGGVIVYPTETVYGLGCDPLNKAAVDLLNILKQRDASKGLILLAATIDQIKPFIDPSCENDLSALEHNARPTSWVIPGHPDLPAWISAPDGSVAVRVTSHPIAARLCQRLGHALVSTSANPGGAQPATNTLQIHKYFHDMIDSVLVSSYPMSAQPSVVKRLMDNATLRE